MMLRGNPGIEVILGYGQETEPWHVEPANIEVSSPQIDKPVSSIRGRSPHFAILRFSLTRNQYIIQTADRS